MKSHPTKAYFDGLYQPLEMVMQPNTIFLGYRGSTVHGMYVPSEDPDSIDDVDVLGIFIGPMEHYTGFGRRETFERKLEMPEAGVLLDSVSYEIRKYVRLAVKANPNVLGTLWTPLEHTLVSSSVWARMVSSRYLFKSKLAYRTFGGYAKSQLGKMTRHEMTPEKSRTITQIEDELSRIELGVKRSFRPDWDQNKLRQELNALNGYMGYMGDKRRELVRRFGYDTKNASHLIRILRMGIEFLDTGEITLDRRGIDAESLLSIKRGEWSLESVQKAARHLFEELDRAHERSPLPDEPRMDVAERLVMNSVREWYQDQGAD